VNFNLVLTNLAGGGAERSMLRLAQALSRRGHGVRLVLLERLVEHAVPPGIEVHALVERASKGFAGKWLAALRLKRFFRTLPQGLTISTLPFADQAAIAARLPNLWCRVTNTLSVEAEGLARSRPRKARRRLARYQSLYEGRNLVAVSDGVLEDLRTRVGLARARIVRIYNGFDLEAIREASALSEPDLPGEPFVLHVGRFSPQKRHDVLLEAWRRAGLAHRLVLLAPASAELDALVRAKGLGDRVLIAGFRANPYPWMRAADILVLSSDREGMPNVLVEALACGTRVVSTDCPSGPREVLRGALARWLVPTGDVEALAQAMRAALAAPRPGRDAVPPDFTEERMASAYEALGAAG
jgi:glycosyltransferase involved in cell wall biosynthesis